jgi:hypothetical protein
MPIEPGVHAAAKPDVAAAGCVGQPWHHAGKGLIEP